MQIFSFLINYILPFVIIISIIIFIHELGHFLTAKKFGVYCGEFSIGMGPLLFSKQIGETQYSIRAIPIGGFVSMAGEVDDTKKEDNIPFSRTINGIKPWKRIVVMLAGIFMNFVLAWVIFVGISMSQGLAKEPSRPVFSEVEKDSVAEKAGILAGDELLAMTRENGKVIKPKSSNAVIEEMNLNAQTFIFVLNRDGKKVNVKITPERNKEGVYRIGTLISSKIKKIEWYEGLKYGTLDTIDNSTLVFRSLGTLVQGKNWDQMSGPVGIVKVTGDISSGGIIPFLNLLALLSLNIGIFNALPIPALDGGRALITILEKITGRKTSEKLLNNLIMGGFIILMGIMVFATWNDLLKLFV